MRGAEGGRRKKIVEKTVNVVSYLKIRSVRHPHSINDPDENVADDNDEKRLRNFLNKGKGKRARA